MDKVAILEGRVSDLELLAATLRWKLAEVYSDPAYTVARMSLIDAIDKAVPNNWLLISQDQT